MTIKVITEPKVYVVGRQEVDDTELDRFLTDEAVPFWSTDTEVPAEELAEVAGRLCYMSFANPRPGGNKAYVGHILDCGHGSVLEHAVWNLIFTGVSRSLTHELVRHRAGFGFSQLSQRYVDASDVAFVVPPMMLPHHAEWAEHLVENAKYKAVIGDWDSGLKRGPLAQVFEDWVQGRDADLREYAGLAEALEECVVGGTVPLATRKQLREAARSVLPNCTATSIFVTGNARAWRGFLEQRGSAGADAEIRRLACAVAAALKAEAPNLFADVTVADGRVTVGHHKV